MDKKNPTFDSLPQLVSSLINEVEGLKTLVTDAICVSAKTQDDSLVGVDEACRILRRKKSTVYHLVRDGILPHYKVGKMLEFRPSELLAWQQRHASNATKSSDEIMAEMKSGIRRTPKSGW